jgi:hypothetical protein
LAWPGFIDNLRESAQLLGLAIGVPAAIVGLFKALYEIRANREQRSTELRWKRANLAKELLDDIHRHDQARNAVHMLDWRHAQIVYELTAGHTETISYSDVLAALKKNQAEAQGQKDIYIRDCFDWFFYRIDRIEHYIRRELIDFEDVKAVFKVYALEIAKEGLTYEDFLDFHGYELARKFFARYTQ